MRNTKETNNYSKEIKNFKGNQRVAQVLSHPNQAFDEKKKKCHEPMFEYQAPRC